MLSKFFLKRPVFAWVIAIFIMLLGCLAIYNLPGAYPNVAPSVSIAARYRVNPQKPSKITQVIEQKMTKAAITCPRCLRHRTPGLTPHRH